MRGFLQIFKSGRMKKICPENPHPADGGMLKFVDKFSRCKLRIKKFIQI